MLKNVLHIVYLSLIVNTYAFSQLTSGFSLNPNSCRNEILSLTNSSSTGQVYEWDFCADDISQTPSINLGNVISGISTNSSGFDIAFDGTNWFGFATDASNNKIIRLNYEENPSLDPVSTDDLGNPGSHLSAPEGIDLIKVGTSWHAFIAYGNNGGSLVRWDFGNGLENPPTSTANIGSVGLAGRIREVRIVNEGSSYYLVFPYYNLNQLVTVDLGSDITYVPNSGDAVFTTITGSSLPRGFGLVRNDGNWIAFFANEGNDTFQQILIGSNITGVPSVQRTISSEITSGYRCSIVESGGEFIAFISNLNSPTTILNLRDLEVANGYVTVSNSGVSNFLGIKAFKNQGKLVLTGIVSLRPNEVVFEEVCAASTIVSSEFEPANISYSLGDTYKIDLMVRDDEDSLQQSSISQTVLSQTAPDISFNTTNQCIANVNTFTPSVSGLTYSWDFDSNGIADSTQEVPNHQFPSVGTYVTRLDINDGTCTNFATSSITIYNEPTTPSYTLSKSQFCVGEAFKAANTTDTVGFDDNITFTWTIAETGQQFNGYNPDFSIAASGSYTLQCQTSIPGCQSSMINTALNVIPSPTTDFSFTPTCLGETTTFTNLTSDVSSYLWDFGDGFTSTLENPQHLYDTAGTYTVSLTTTNSTGCSTLSSQSVTVKSVPTAGFQAVLPCEGEVSINDTSSVLNSSITSWQWFLEGELVSTSQNPQITIPESGNYQIREIVTSALNCSSEASQTLTVLDAASPNFSVVSACNGSPFSFGDISTTASNNLIISRSWNVNGTTYTDSSFQHTFPNPGRFPVALTVVTQNLCAVTFSDSVIVADEPLLDFSIPDACQNEFLSIQDLSTATNDTIVSRQWFVDEELSGNGVAFVFKFTQDTVFNVRLRVTTQLQCTYDLTKTVVVQPSGDASFEPSSTFGVQGSTISFENTSNLGNTYQWFVDGDSTSAEANYTHTFNTSGNHEVLLISVTESACRDTVLSNILIQIPVVDLLLREVLLNDENDGFSSIVASVENQSNLPVENLRFTIQIDDQLPTRDRIDQIIGVGESRVVQLDADVPNTATYICINVSTTYDAEDLNDADNEYCISNDPEIIFEAPFPNPATDDVTVRTILPQEGKVTVSLINMSGKMELTETFNDLASGLQSFNFSVATYDPGIYLLQITYNNTVEVIRFLKQ